MIKPGEVKAVRELNGRVQAQVCLGADVEKGSAIITVESRSPEVLAALDDLKAALRREARSLVGDILEGQRRWDEEMSA